MKYMRLYGERRKLSFTSKAIRNPEMLIQYILVRTDMASMTIGRVAAQCAHAANQMVEDAAVEQAATPLSRYAMKTKDELDQWKREANGFGTAIVLDVGNEATLRATIEKARGLNLHAGLVIDPEYYIMDGDAAMRVVDVLTCGYIFGRKEECHPITSNFKLLGA